MKVPVSVEGEVRKGTIVSRKRDSDDNPIGTKTDNPIMDSRQYEVEFSDGSYDTMRKGLKVSSKYS